MDKVDTIESEIEGRNSLIRKVYRDGYQYASNVIYISEGQEPKDIFCSYEQPEEIYEKTKKAEKDFHEILENVMGEEKLPQRLQMFLQNQKIECAAVLKEYDGIILELKTSLKDKDKDYRMKMENQRVQRDLLQKRVENFMSELANAGKTEIAALRETIVKRTKDVSDESWKNINEFFDGRSSDKAYDSHLWVELSDKITSQQVQDAFLSDQKDIFELRMKLFHDVCKLRGELEKQKAEYNLNREKLDQGLFELKKSYGKNIPLLARMKREYVFLTDKKGTLLRKLKEIKQEMADEHKFQEEDYSKLSKRITTIKQSNRQNRDRTAVKYYKVFKVRSAEANELLTHIIEADKIIHEQILKVPWKLNDMQISQFKESDSGVFQQTSEDSLTSNSNAQTKLSKNGRATSESSAFSAASDTSVDDVDWETLLHCIADEMGYILDHHWVEYFKTAMPKEKAVFTLGELCKLFKVRPEEDLNELKAHMLPFCKFVSNENEAEKLHIDHKGILEGFRRYLSEIQKKRNEPEFPQKYASVLKYQEGYWNGFLNALPRTLLWDAVLEGLEQYLSCQKTRSKLLDMKSALTQQNAELERCLSYYRPFA